jgi:diguanylate cyclase (GGDEF)-like protein
MINSGKGHQGLVRSILVSADIPLVTLRWLRRRGDSAPPVDHRAVRQAAGLFVAAGSLGLITDFLPGAVGPGSKVLDSINLLIGILGFTRLTKRLTGYRSLVFALLGMAGIALNNVVGALPVPTLGIWFVLIFLWIGSWHRRGVCVAMAPFAVAAYLVPYAFGAPTASGSVGSVVLIVPVAVLAGEVIAANVDRSRRLARDQERAVDALAKANLTDDLTGLGNRRFGNQVLDSMQPGDALALLDLDHFKVVNDRFGHARGDQLLQELGEFLRNEVRVGDDVARMGGEEFMLILRQPVRTQVFASVDRVVSGWRASAPLSTLSAGVTVHEANQSPTDTYRAADEALYAAKATGRDQVISRVLKPMAMRAQSAVDATT